MTLHVSLELTGITRSELEHGCGYDDVSEPALPIAPRNLAPLDDAQTAARIDELNAAYHTAELLSVGSGVHCDTTAHGAWHSNQPLHSAEACRRGLAREPWSRKSGTYPPALRPIDTLHDLVHSLAQLDDDPLEPVIVNQYVRSQTERQPPAARLAAVSQHFDDVIAAARHHYGRGRSADAICRVTRERLVQPHPTPDARGQLAES